MFVSGCFCDCVEWVVCVLKCIGVEVFVVGIGWGVIRKELIKIVINGVYVFMIFLRMLLVVFYIIRNKVCLGIVYFFLMLVNIYFLY